MSSVIENTNVNNIYEGEYIMKIIEAIANELATTTNVTKEVYEELETRLTAHTGEYFANKEVTCTSYGSGVISGFSGNTLENLVVEITFLSGIKRFSLMHILSNSFIKFTDTSEISSFWEAVTHVHNMIVNEYTAATRRAKQLIAEAEKTAEAEKKAEAQYIKAKDKAIRDFDAMSRTVRAKREYASFYEALGWLVSHIGTVYAAIPDYLQSFFEAYFGTDATPYVYDSKKKTSGGFRYQWTVGMTARLRRKGLTEIPAVLSEHLSASGQAIADTSFIWELIDNYGFQFGKKQDVERIRCTIPNQFIDSFEAGLLR